MRFTIILFFINMSLFEKTFEVLAVKTLGNSSEFEKKKYKIL
jgi:hypothetical protein